MSMIKFSFTAIFTMIIALRAMSVPTNITIRVKAKDAKFIGTGIGGAFVVIRNNQTGALLSSGVTTGSSGDTKLFLQTLHGRYQPLTDDQTAKYIATIDIAEPELIDIEVTAPVSRRGSAIKGSVQVWLIPGKDIAGDGIILELPGLILDIIAPSSHQFIALNTLAGKVLSFRVSLTMLCGCPITEGGVWDAADFEVQAVLKKEGVEVGRYALVKGKESNIFEGQLPVAAKGSYELSVYAFQAKANNSGVDKINFVIQ